MTEPTQGASPAVQPSATITDTVITNPTPIQSDASAMLSHLKKVQQPKATLQVAEVPTATPTQIEEVEGDIVEQSAEPISEGENDEVAAEGPTESKDNNADKTVPLKAFKKRVSELSAEKRELKQQLANNSHELAVHQEAVKVLQQELERYRNIAKEGLGFDDRDEQLRGYELQQQLAQRNEELMAENRKRLQEIHREERLHEITAQVKSELRDALSTAPLVSQQELAAAMRANPTRSAKQLAAVINAKKLEAARKVLGQQTPRPNAPATARAQPNGAAQVQHPANAAGMLARLKELQQYNRI